MEKSTVSGDTKNSSSNSVVSLISRMEKCLISGDNKSNDEDMIACEILSRLPVKSLMRFKSVSKTWLSLIEDDPYFADLHFARSKLRPALLMVVPRRRDPDNPYKVISKLYLTAYLTRDGRKAEIYSTGKSKSFSCNEIRGPVNGFICLVDRPKSDVRLYNISTKEVTPLVKSTLLESGTSFPKSFEFGFDPITKKYKVLCVCVNDLQQGQNHLGDQYNACEVLTVGDNAWRRIDGVPPCDLARSSVYMNGSIYYCTSKFKSGNWDNNDAVLVAFDVGNEKFTMISIPNLILNNWPSGRYLIGDLLEVDGHVAICCRKTAYIVKLWVYKGGTDYDNKGKKTKTSKLGNCEENWSDNTITLPFAWDNNLQWCFYSGVEVHQILIQSDQRPNKSMDSATLYSYDLKKKAFAKIEVSGYPSSILNGRCIRLALPFVESLFPIQKQRRSSEAPHLNIQQHESLNIG